MLVHRTKIFVRSTSVGSDISYIISKHSRPWSSMINNKGADQTVRVWRLVCTFVVRKPPKSGFSSTFAHVKTAVSSCKKFLSCIDICLKPLKFMFISCDHVLFEHVFYLTKTKLGPAMLADVCMTLHGKALRPWLIISPMLSLHTYMTLWRRNDVQKFEADAILFREIQCKKMDFFFCLSDVSSAVYVGIR